MGGLSSWGIFALCHHIIIQYAASQVGKPIWFEDYYILGDDTVIFNKDVAEKYKEVINSLGVDISMEKSLISYDTFEFAKRLFSRGEELTAFPLAAIMKNSDSFAAI